MTTSSGSGSAWSVPSFTGRTNSSATSISAREGNQQPLVIAPDGTLPATIRTSFKVRDEGFTVLAEPARADDTSVE
jgi:hypothetical protein